MFTRWTLFVAGVIILAVAVILRAHDLFALQASDAVAVALVTDAGPDDPIERSYGIAMSDLGIPYQVVSTAQFLLLGSQRIHELFPVAIFPDQIDRQVPAQLQSAVYDYAHAGGSAIIVCDAGTRKNDNKFRDIAIFTDPLGVAYGQYTKLRARSYVRGPLRFLSKGAAVAWNVPSGKRDERLNLTTYQYGVEQLSLPNASVVDGSVHVDAVTTGGGVVISRRAIGAGSATYVGAPLGFLATRSDRFPLNAVLQRAVSERAVPHLLSSPNGIGALIVDFHIDSSREFSGVKNLERKRLLSHKLHFQFDITAGPDRDRPRDHLGVDACGRGRWLVTTLAKFGAIGSHGGWAHNEFAHDVEAHRLSEAQMEHLIDKNNVCLRSVVHHPILAYAAPAGAHPQPAMTQALANLGMTGYYYTGDSGGVAERAIYNGRVISDSVVAFPIMPFRDQASVAEVVEAHVSPKTYGAWLNSLVDTVASTRLTYLWYSHSYDFDFHPEFVQPFREFEGHLLAAQRDRRLQLLDTPRAAAFSLRLWQTQASFLRDGSVLRVRLQNPISLQEVAFAVPRTARNPHNKDVRAVGSDQRFSYYAVTANKKDLEVDFAT